MRLLSRFTPLLLFALSGTITSFADPIVTIDVPMVRPEVVAFSPDGKQAAVGGLEKMTDAPGAGVVALVDVAAGQQRALLKHSGVVKTGNGRSSTMNRIQDVAFSPDGKLLAVAAELGLKLWDPASGQELATLAGYELAYRTREFVIGGVPAIAFSPDGKLLAAVNSRNGRLTLWDVAKREPVRTIETESDGDVAFSKDGVLLVTAEHQNRVRLWRVADGEQVAEVHAEMGPLYGVAIDPSGERVAAVGEGGEKIWRIETDGDGRWRFVDEVRLAGYGPFSPIRGVAFSPDGRILATFSDSGVTMIYDAVTHATVGSLWSGGPCAFSPDGKLLAVAELVRGAREPTSRFSIWATADVLNKDRLAAQARTAANELVRIVESGRPDYDVQPRAMAVLGGPESAAATPTLIAALANRQIQQKQLIAMALGRLAANSADAVAALAKAVREDPAVDTRAAAAMALSMTPREAAAPSLSTLAAATLNDESPDVQRAALHALRRLDAKAYADANVALRARGLVQPQVVERKGQLMYEGRSLEEWIERLGVTYVPNEIFGRPSPQAPLAAIRAFGAGAVPALIEALKSPRWETRQGAAAGLEALGPQAKSAIGPLEDALAAATPEDRNAAGAAADALASILKGQKPSVRLLELADSDSLFVRLAAARAVAQLDSDHPRGLPALKAAGAAAIIHPMRGPMMMAPFPEQPPVRWLAKTLADDEAPTMHRLSAAATLARLKANAFEALPAMIKAVGAKDDNVSQYAGQAIVELGPKAIPALRDALKTESNGPVRKRLATALASLGDDGRRTLTEILEDDEAQQLWWAAALGAAPPNTAMNFQIAVNEALTKCGQRQAFAPGQAAPPPAFPRHEQPTAKWSAKLLADGDAPRSLRMTAANQLLRARGEDILPVLPEILVSINQEQDRALISQLANVIQRMGPPAIPAVYGAIDQARSGPARRELLRALSSLGEEGQREFSQLMSSHAEYRELFDAKSNSPTPKTSHGPASDSPQTSREGRAIAEASQTNRPLTNGNFLKGFDGWHLEGGSGAFNLFPQGNGQALSTFGKRQDADTGRVFQCFKVPGDAETLAFKLHGGANAEKTFVALWSKGRRQGKLAAKNDNTPFPANFDLMKLRGEVVTLEIVDESREGWGFIGVEDFHIVRAKQLIERKLAPQKFAFDVELQGRQGQAIFGRIDTANDALVITSWIGPADKTWTPLTAELPMTLYAYSADGQPYDVPDDWNGKISGWAFLLPPERDLTSVAWKEGAVTEFWKGASFGWGGLRNSSGKVVTGRPGSDETGRFRYVPMEGNSTSDITFGEVKVSSIRKTR